MRPMSAYFDQIYGVDVSDSMVAIAREKLGDIPHAFPHAIGGSDLKMFPDRHFDFVYSYAVFQHIPDPGVVFSYLRETVRVLRPGGVARLQLNGLPKAGGGYTTWEGVRIGAGEIHRFAREHGVELLALTGVDSQYMWTTWRKPAATDAIPGTGLCRVRAVSNAFSSEQAVPATGRLACVAASVENLPAGCELNSLSAFVGGALPENLGRVCYIGPRERNGFSQVNIFLPHGVRTGLLPLRLEWRGEQIAAEKSVRVIRPGPTVPRMNSLTDGVNLMSRRRIESGLVKVSIEEVDAIEGFGATVDGVDVENIETFRADPLTERWEVNFELPRAVEAGERVLEIRLGKRILATMGIEVVQ
jgi:SAM-dependent methyltransferase